MFVLSDTHDIAAIFKKDGAIRWAHSLAEFDPRDATRDITPALYGPILAGNAVLVLDANGTLSTFKPADASKAWISRAVIQFAAFAVAVVSIMFVMLAVTHAGAEHGYTLSSLLHALQHDAITTGAAIAFAVSTALLFALGRSTWVVNFGEVNAIDVEGMGLYWHFVDIVWIVIFTVVYLLEYL
jgi:hypothetical protein